MVSDTGLIFSLVSNKILKPNYMKNGYLSVELFEKHGKSKRCLIHRLVAETFIPNPDNKPCVNHKDENKHNNAVNNLEWCTVLYNVNYGNAQVRKAQNRTITEKIKSAAKNNGLSRRIPVVQYTKDGIYIKTFNCAMDVERTLNINHSHIIENCKNKRKSAGGYRWQYERSVDLSVS